VTLLGGFQARSAPRTRHLASKKAQALLGYLSLRPQFHPGKS
jgi:hypothetical protein